MEGIEEKDLIARADAQAWNDETDELISIEKVETDLKPELGVYSITFTTVRSIIDHQNDPSYRPTGCTQSKEKRRGICLLISLNLKKKLKNLSL